jgi:EAL domain-containing protein (putative c-di-GMP-specific phosphodiesterase class I)
MASEQSNAIIIQSSIAMAHSLDLKVVAEGAEDAATCAALATEECDFVQGYYISRPLSSPQLQAWLLRGGSLGLEPFRPEATIVERPVLQVVAS